MANPNDDLPAIHIPQCHVCTSDYRGLVEKMAATGETFANIARHVQERDASLSRKSIERHIHNHASFKDKANRALLEKRAAEIGVAEDSAAISLVTAQAVLDKIIQKGWAQLSENEQRVRMEDVLRAVEMSEKLESDISATLIEDTTKKLDAIITAVREIVPQEYHAAIVIRARKVYDSDDLTRIAVVDPPQIGP